MNTEEIYHGIKSIHERADWDMENFSKPCAAGCSSCCHQSISIFSLEGMVLERFIKRRLSPHQKENSKARTEYWLNIFNQVTRDATIDNPITEAEFFQAEKQMTGLRVPCPLLEDGMCSVYEDRPLVCRTYAVENNPHECAKNPFRVRSNLSMELYRSHLSDYFKLEQQLIMLRPLAYAISDVLSVTIPIKPIRLSARSL